MHCFFDIILKKEELFDQRILHPAKALLTGFLFGYTVFQSRSCFNSEPEDLLLLFLIDVPPSSFSSCPSTKLTSSREVVSSFLKYSISDRINFRSRAFSASLFNLKKYIYYEQMQLCDWQLYISSPLNFTFKGEIKEFS